MKYYFKLLIVAISAILLLSACAGGNTTAPNEQQEQEEQQEKNRETETDQEDSAPITDEENTDVYTVTLYFPDRDLMELYREQREVKANTEEELPKIALQAWVEGPEHNDLSALVPADVVVEYVEDKDGIAYVSLSQEIKNANLGSSGEIYIVEAITMIMEQFGFEQTQILVEGEIEETLIGHMSIDQPYQAANPNDYKMK